MICHTTNIIKNTYNCKKFLIILFWKVISRKSQISLADKTIMTNLINEKDEFNGEKNISRKILIKNGFTSDKVC